MLLNYFDAIELQCCIVSVYKQDDRISLQTRSIRLTGRKQTKIIASKLLLLYITNHLLLEKERT